MNAIRFGLLPLLFGAAGLALGHHSFRATYDSTREMEITGVVAGYVLKSPHSMLLLDVTDEAGEVEQFEVEMASLPMMRRRGFDEDTFQLGDEVTVIAWPHRASVPLVWARGYITADGTTLGENASYAARPAEDGAGALEKLEGRWLAPFARVATESPLPLTAAGVAAREDFDPQRSPANTCEPNNVPAVFYSPYLFDIRVVDQQAIIRHESYNVTRTVPLNTGPRLAEATGVFGMVTGRIEGDELVVESSGYPPSGWGLAVAGTTNGAGADVPSSAEKTLIERYSASDDGSSLTYSYTLEDPIYLTEPYSSQVELSRVPDDEPMHVYDCELESATRFSRDL